MENITFDTGLRSYRVGNGVLRFNPADPNLYARFQQALEGIEALEETLKGEGDTVSRLADADKKAKALLSQVFGSDVEEVFGGLSLLAVGENGQLLLTNFLNAIEPILTEGARRCAAAEGARLR